MLFKRILFFAIIGIFFVNNLCFGSTLFENESFIFSLNSYFRTDIINFKNVVDLDSANRDDTTTYFAIDYNLGFLLENWYKDIKFYLKLERNGPYDYGAPLFVHNTLINSGGQIDKYRNEQLLPNIEEFWLKAPIFNPFGFKIGLYTYEVGNGFSLNGAYENYGFTIFKETEDFSWRVYYCRPDIHNKYQFGPKIPQDRDQDIVYEPGNAANFFATDVKFKKEKNIFQPYIGALVDHTSSGKRDNLFTSPIKRDILGTLGLFWSFSHSDLTWTIELAHNFGKGKSENPNFKDVYHTGYLIYTGDHLYQWQK